jgi:predicted permease
MAMRWRGERWIDVQGLVREALRGVRRSPGFVAAVVLTLALGLGVNAAMFGVVDQVLLSPPAHIRDADQVKRVMRHGPFFGRIMTSPGVTYPDIVDLRTVPGLVSVGATSSLTDLTLGSGPEARRVRARRVTHDLITTLGVEAERGRFFGPEDDRPDSPLTVVVSREFWETSMGSDRDVLGRTLRLAGLEATVIGVAPPGFTGTGLEAVDVWLPAVAFEVQLRTDDGFLTSYGSYWLQAIVRVADEAVVAPAEERATALVRASRESWTDTDVMLTPLIEANGPTASSSSRVARWTGGVSLLVLLLACANVANLLLVRAAERRREVAVRLSLGVSRARLVGERVVETLVLAGIGGVAALVLARWGGGLIRATLFPGMLFATSEVSGRVVIFVALLAAAAGLLAGLGPAWQGTRVDIAKDLASGGRGGSLRRSRGRSALTVAQAVISTVLLVGAGLFLRSLSEARNADLGFDVDSLVVVRLELDPAMEAAERTRIYEEAMDVARRVPGATAVVATDVPYQNMYIETLRVPGFDSLPVPPGGGPFYYGVTPGYAGAVGLALLHGRDIEPSDVEGPPVALVSQLMAETLWPDGNALGQCLYRSRDDDAECFRVVGVAENGSYEGLEDGPHWAYHVPLGNRPDRAPDGLYVRAGGDPRELATRLAPALRAFSPRVRFAEVQPMRDLVDPDLRAWRMGAVLFTTFGVLALLVASVGLYSVLAFDVAQQTREIGIRSALGAARSRVLRGVLFTGARLAVLGALIGTATSLAAAPFVGGLLYRVEATDPWVLTSVAMVLVLVAAGASLVPGMRAAAVDPAEALRAE